MNKYTRIFILVAVVFVFISIPFVFKCPVYGSTIVPDSGSFVCGYYINNNWNYYVNPLTIIVCLICLGLVWPLRKDASYKK